MIAPRPVGILTSGLDQWRIRDHGLVPEPIFALLHRSVGSKPAFCSVHWPVTGRSAGSLLRGSGRDPPYRSLFAECLPRGGVRRRACWVPRPRPGRECPYKDPYSASLPRSAGWVPGRDRKTNPLQRPARPTRSLPEPGHQRTSERPCLLPIELVAKPPRQSRRPKGAGAAIDPQDVQGAMQRSGEGHLPLTVTCPVDPSRCRADMVRAVAVPGPQHHQQACKRTNAAVSQLGKFSTSSTPPERRHLIQSPRRRGQGSRAEG